MSMAKERKTGDLVATGPRREEQPGFIASVLGESPVNRANNPYAPYLSRSILLEEVTPPQNVRAAISLISIMLAGFVIWASITPIEERSSGSGEIIPVGFVQPVQHLEGGILSEILVQEGDLVEAGQPLILLDQMISRAEYDSLASRNASLSLEIERLNALANNREPDFQAVLATLPDGSGNFADILADQREIYEGQISARNAQVRVIQRQLQEFRQDLAGLRENEAALAEEVSLIQQEVETRRGLVEKGLSSRLLYLNAQRDLAGSRGDLATVRAEIEQIETQIERGADRIVELDEQLRSQALTRMGQASSEQAQVSAQLRRLGDRLRRTVITAPTSGQVKGVVRKPPGGVITTGETLMEIVPNQQGLLAEVRIAPRDIGHIRAGQPAVVKVETYSFARYGGIEGIVDRVSASSFQAEDGSFYFRAQIRLAQNYVGDNPAANLVSPGMTVIADIKTGEKSLMQYLLRPVANTVSDSFGER